MKLGEKPTYPLLTEQGLYELDFVIDSKAKDNCAIGLTFRERLIVALASNPDMVGSIGTIPSEHKQIAERQAQKIVIQADAIIKQLESEAKNER